MPITKKNAKINKNYRYPLPTNKKTLGFVSSKVVLLSFTGRP